MTADDGGDDERPWEQPAAVRRDCEPHRGVLLRALGGASVVLVALTMVLVVPGLLAVPFSVSVLVAARRDLRKMAAGVMDPAGSCQPTSPARMVTVRGSASAAARGPPQAG